ncbi:MULTISPECIES: ferredoxin [Streptomyces]|uniref:Ferredoxin n=1 Tax=Streptomyces andamanensis TaxID=1565035 RepID=A0ABV8TPZ2_9ACTN|nr:MULTISPECIES: ferredoxin [unclassified Streptomyces]ANH94774.1 ferredoxin [Streptomyces sp. SAT1]EYT82482.1 ferredoxin [Streptomyces sp. Tu 6176]MYR56780.1 ferredoxin [Streptomyces sp. SID625]
MRIDIDKDRCIGAGQCALAAPGVFTQDDEGFSALLPGREDGGGDPMVKEAARACPVSAITVTEKDGAARATG